MHHFHLMIKPIGIEEDRDLLIQEIDIKIETREAVEIEIIIETEAQWIKKEADHHLQEDIRTMIEVEITGIEMTVEEKVEDMNNSPTFFKSNLLLTDLQMFNLLSIKDQNLRRTIIKKTLVI